MDFRTKVVVEPTGLTLSHSDRFFVMGSCFAGNIGTRLTQSGFRTTINPFGVLFNPASVGMSLERLINHMPFKQAELVEKDGWYHSFSHHGSFSGQEPSKTLRAMNASFKDAENALKQASCLILTFGTAWVYALPSSEQIVANCHKFPESYFLRRRLTVDEIVEYYEGLLDTLFSRNPSLNVLFTVSPIRHWKDGAHENTLSKSVLHLAVSQLCETFERVDYFPAYELMMDDLRDYRFYADDMLHPSETAQEYVWTRFADAFFSKETQAINQKVRQLYKAMQHRPQDVKTATYKQFLDKNRAAIEGLLSAHPEVELSEVSHYFEHIR